MAKESSLKNSSTEIMESLDFISRIDRQEKFYKSKFNSIDGMFAKIMRR